jgi:hypothetical protein
MTYTIFIRDIATDKVIRQEHPYSDAPGSPIPRIGETVREPHQGDTWKVVDVVHNWVSSGRGSDDKCLAVVVYVERKEV